MTLGTPGWVDRQSDADPSQTVGVTAENISSVAFDYDRAATIAATLAGVHAGNAGQRGPGDGREHGAAPGRYQGRERARAPSAASRACSPSRAASRRGPACARDADPEGADASGTPFWPGASRDPAISVDPGATTTASVTMATVNLRFTRASAGSPVTIQAVHAADNGCGSGETLTLAVFPGDGAQLVALPWGTWTFQAVGATAVTSWSRVALDPNLDQVFDASVQIR